MADHEGAWINDSYTLINVDLDELRSAGLRLGSIADRLSGIRMGIINHAASARDSAPMDWGAGGTRLHQLYAGCDALLQAVSGLQALSEHVATTVASYADREGKAQGAFDGLGAGLNTVLPALSSPLSFLLIGGPALQAGLEMRMKLTGQKDPVKALTQVLAEQFGGEKVARELEGRMSVVARHSTVAPGVPGKGDLLGGTLRTVQTSYGTAEPLRDGTPFQGKQNQIPESSVIVDKALRKDGSWAVLVSVPGVQNTGQKSARTTNDLYAAVMTANQENNPGKYLTQSQVTVMKALEAEKIGKKDQMVITGHSLGGMNAVALATDKDFREKYTVRAVTTAGSPVGNSVGRIPADTSVLAMENDQDPVPALDHAVNPGRDHVTTATMEVASSGGPLGPHQIASYIPTGEALDASGDPAIERHLSTLEDVFGEDQLARDPEGRIITSRAVYTGTVMEDPCKVAPPVASPDVIQNSAESFSRGKPRVAPVR
ncbi:MULTISPECIES: hypothetical protein [Arthrobacter]|uniref:Fungal lipase-type domain-containing protein n=2 Tax=Arthrobacter TaxID=1663 RepID=A0ABU9KJ72_9MICC|nr:hypothetical protein [Arthrobacter sp. YJM1]MDP5226819.1 hypothetical protein [Arthrobacter sp. YJM1]